MMLPAIAACPPARAHERRDQRALGDRIRFEARHQRIERQPVRLAARDQAGERIGRVNDIGIAEPQPIGRIAGVAHALLQRP